MNITERRPTGTGWVEYRHPRLDGAIVIYGSAWRNGRLQVLSCLELAELPDRSGVGPQWHVSVTATLSDGTLERVRKHELAMVLRAFDMVGAEEDNHHPGNARHFWLPVDPQHRVDCECKADEVTVVDPDGYRWQNPADPAECRGCAWARQYGGECRLHAEAAPR